MEPEHDHIRLAKRLVGTVDASDTRPEDVRLRAAQVQALIGIAEELHQMNRPKPDMAEAVKRTAS